MNKAAFLDRDGVINVDYHYVHEIEKFDFIPGSIEAIKMLNNAGFLVIVVSNQSGIAKGYYPESDCIALNEHMKRELEKQNAKIDAIYYCPHDNADNCDCRKPKPGMLLKGAKDFEISVGNSWMVGDKELDVIAGHSAGCKSIIVRTGHGNDELKQKKIDADFIANDLLDAVKHILNQK